ncbi:deoxyribodipyrimidine photo-lyase [Leucobacter weissii]|uniref:Deoxyribodipyrimidine photo-lyase n=1 Tax=Leucobacter weissii TaxID=1983706 RepID=A0A939MK79_9MICO|nr:deoxyribodipyrimidine photo-lyase [Leucobacter weissii]MBO1902504.1 deoxyribodipyrimidine photo-lyase [Leucobacter weissii]
MATVVWFRDDLRISDHPALLEASLDPDGLVCVYILDEESPGIRPLGGAAKWWLHHSLSALDEDLRGLGAPLVLRRGPAEEVLPELVAEASADRVLWNRRYGAAERALDTRLKSALRERGVAAHSFAASLLHEPWTVQTGAGEHFKVYSPFWRACLAGPPPRAPLAAPGALRSSGSLGGAELAEWGLTPEAHDWATGLAERWRPGESSAERALERFLTGSADRYAAERDLPGSDAVSGLSPHLRWGEISPHTVWHRAIASGRDVGMFLSELGWREFAWHTLFHRPELADRNLDARFDAFPWRSLDAEEWTAWRFGRTGIPLVDAGMRELWRTGTMHNRVRMVVASFLTKNLLADWRAGERWFWDTLVDADAASNPFNWQWVAGCGADAAPYFRIFNPLTQQQKFDADGAYVDLWAPDSLALAPLVDLKESRRRALDAFDEMKRSG